MPGDADTVFVAAEEGGLYRSTDGGQQWERLDGTPMCRGNGGEVTPLPVGLKVRALVATQEALYAGTWERELARSPQGGVYSSHDGGVCWQQVDRAEGRYGYQALTPVPGTPGDFLVLTYDHAATGDGPVYQLWHFREGQGRTAVQWASRHTAWALYVAAGNPPTWYVATGVGEVYRGTLNGGRVVQRLPRVTRCLLPPTCFADLAPDVRPGPPLLLANNRVYRQGTVPWYRYLWP